MVRHFSILIFENIDKSRKDKGIIEEEVLVNEVE